MEKGNTREREEIIACNDAHLCVISVVFVCWELALEFDYNCSCFFLSFFLVKVNLSLNRGEILFRVLFTTPKTRVRGRVSEGLLIC